MTNILKRKQNTYKGQVIGKIHWLILRIPHCVCRFHFSNLHKPWQIGWSLPFEWFSIHFSILKVIRHRYIKPLFSCVPNTPDATKKCPSFVYKSRMWGFSLSHSFKNENLCFKSFMHPESHNTKTFIGEV